VRRKRWFFALLSAMLIPGAQLVAQAPAVGQPAPTVTVADLDGKPVRVGLAPGKRGAVVEFWATWCELCRALLPSMRAAQQQYGDRVDFYGVNVTVNDGKDHVRRYVAQNHPPFTTVYDDRGVAVRAFGALATSYVVIIDHNGRVAYTGDGADQNIPAELAKVLAR
jgi:cytochrome c biogenesis protein CcmG/thiol:disulfide interchange protein DsbE